MVAYKALNTFDLFSPISLSQMMSLVDASVHHKGNISFVLFHAPNAL